MVVSLAQLGQHLKRAFTSNVVKSSQEAKVVYPRRVKDTVVSLSIKPATLSGLDMPVTPHYIPPRAPIVLCHGLYGFDKIGPDALPLLQIQYWGGIENALAKLGANVIVTKVPSTGSIWDRAQTLHSILKSILDGQDVNFVAHSMGGLDCRYLISHIKDRPYKVNSLTTISTPHRGSPVMDWFRDNVGVGKALMQAHQHNLQRGDHYMNAFLQKAIQLLDTAAYANLTTDYCRDDFNPNTPNDPHVKYYSYGASAKFPSWSLFNLPCQLIKEKEGLNDGLVSVDSAKWGVYLKTLEADHWDLNGQRYRWGKPVLKANFDTVEFYMEMATNLYKQGH